MLDFTLSDAQRQMQRDARSFASNILAGAHDTYSKHNTQTERYRSTRPLYRLATGGGMVQAQVPTQLGGSCDSLLDAVVQLEELYAMNPSVTLTLAATGLGLTPLILSGHERLQRQHLKPFLSLEGEPLASLVHSEPTGTANWLERGGKGLQTTARKEGNEWIVNGEKLWTTNSSGWDGRGADLQCVICRKIEQDDNAVAHAYGNGVNRVNGHANDPAESIIILLVTREVIAGNEPEAYTVLDEPQLLGHPATSGPHSRFTNLCVPEDQVLAEGAHAASLVEQSFTASAAFVGAFSVSIMRAAFDAALKFAREDSRGGSIPIIHRQSVADLLMDIKMRADASRLLTWKAIHALENGPGDFAARQELCLEAKVFASDNCVKSVTDAMSAVGMTSYRKDQPFARLLKDAMCLPLFDGGNIGVRRRQMEKIMQADGYAPWSAV